MLKKENIKLIINNINILYLSSLLNMISHIYKYIYENKVINKKSLKNDIILAPLYVSVLQTLYNDNISIIQNQTKKSQLRLFFKFFKYLYSRECHYKSTI